MMLTSAERRVVEQATEDASAADLIAAGAVDIVQPDDLHVHLLDGGSGLAFLAGSGEVEASRRKIKL